MSKHPEELYELLDHIFEKLSDEQVKEYMNNYPELVGAVDKKYLLGHLEEIDILDEADAIVRRNRTGFLPEEL